MSGDVEVKGLWFQSTRSYLDRTGGDALLREIAGRMTDHSEALLDPITGAWYPEEALHELLESLWKHVDGDVERDSRRAATHSGKNSSPAADNGFSFF